MQMEASPAGKNAMLKVSPLSDPRCQRIVVHLGGWASSEANAVRELAPNQGHELEVNLVN
jgi:hypothetical protein